MRLDVDVTTAPSLAIIPDNSGQRMVCYEKQDACKIAKICPPSYNVAWVPQ